MTSRVTKLTTFVVALVAAAGISAPSALAMPADSPFHSTAQQSRPAQPVPPVAAPDPAGFDWSAAALGALIASGGCIVLFGVGLDVRRRHRPKTV
jgi:hypothetical protein